MKTKHNLNHFKLALVVSVLALPLITHAAQQNKKEHPRYKLIDLGTLGGPQYYDNFSGQQPRLLNNQGTVVGGMDTAIPDPFCFNPDCFTSHAFQWRKGFLSDLGTLAFNESGNFSQAFWINEGGLSVGVATDNGFDDHLGFPVFKAVIWKDGQIIDLGTLGGNFSFAQAVNNRGQVVGWALNTVPDLIGIWPFEFGTQQRAVLWQNGKIQDLGTLGGPSAWATHLNDRGQVVGQSYTTEPTLIPVEEGELVWFAATRAFLWENGAMVDLGSLGGTFALPNRINDRGQITGLMTMPGDNTHHPFFWDHGTLTDLGTFGGSNGNAMFINDAGEVAGVADFPGDVLHDAFLWRDGVMTDLGNLGITSFPHGMNSKGQVVGASRIKNGPTGPDTTRAFFWAKGGRMLDLNTLIPSGSDMTLTFALSINDRGEIAGYGVLPNRDQHPFLLIPVGKE